jgi:hypothetical protein
MYYLVFLLMPMLMEWVQDLYSPESLLVQQNFLQMVAKD